MDYLDAIREKHPNIVAHEEDDSDWDNQAFEAIKEKRYTEALSIFEKLCLSQPEHQSGYEGLAYVYYYLDKQEKALWFMEKAIALAREFLKDDSIDIEVIEEMEKNLENIKNKNKLLAWWE